MGPRQREMTGEMRAEIEQALRENEFGSLEEVNAFISTLVKGRNQSPSQYFQGLSPDQMRRFIAFPFDSPDLITYAEAPEAALRTPIMRVFALLVEGIGEKGLKPTETGKLPRNFVRAAELAYNGEEYFKEFAPYKGARTELDFRELHVIRLLSELAGLTRKFQGKFVLTGKFKTLRAKKGLAAVYPLLLRAYTTRYNWAYLGYDDDLPLIQQSFLYTVYLLQRFGAEWRETAFYEDLFMTAYPQTLDEVNPTTYGTPEKILRSAYKSRALDNFASFLGLAEMRSIGERQEYCHEIRKLPLIDEVIKFTL